jgi:hypothetical protein
MTIVFVTIAHAQAVHPPRAKCQEGTKRLGGICGLRALAALGRTKRTLASSLGTAIFIRWFDDYI